MPRVIVTTDRPSLPEGPSVLLDELVHSVHLSDGHAAAQLVERLAWAISDAEDAERRHSARPARASRRGSQRAATRLPRSREAVGA